MSKRVNAIFRGFVHVTLFTPVAIVVGRGLNNIDNSTIFLRRHVFGFLNMNKMVHGDRWVAG